MSNSNDECNKIDDFDPKKQKKKNQKNLLDPNIVKKTNNIHQIKDLENGWGMRHKNCRNK
jgi:hypothetical protein